MTTAVDALVMSTSESLPPPGTVASCSSLAPGALLVGGKSTAGKYSPLCEPGRACSGIHETGYLRPARRCKHRPRGVSARPRHGGGALLVVRKLVAVCHEQDVVPVAAAADRNEGAVKRDANEKGRKMRELGLWRVAHPVGGALPTLASPRQDFKQDMPARSPTELSKQRTPAPWCGFSFSRCPGLALGFISTHSVVSSCGSRRGPALGDKPDRKCQTTISLQSRSCATAASTTEWSTSSGARVSRGTGESLLRRRARRWGCVRLLAHRGAASGLASCRRDTSA